MLPAHVVTRPRPQCFPAGTIRGNPETTKPSVLLGSDGVSGLMMPYVMTPTGVEPVLPP